MRKTLIHILCIFLLTAAGVALRAQPVEEFTGQWVINKQASDKTDDKVEAALRAMGQKTTKGWFSRDDEYYRGGPAEHELYDRISYDRLLGIEFDGEDTYRFTYADDYARPVYTDNRRRSVSLRGLDQVEDFSFAHWEGDVLKVEARVRDGGYTNESYSLINNGMQLKVELYIEPRSFTVPIELTRVYDRRS